MANTQIDRVMDSVTSAQSSVKAALKIGNDIEFDRVDVTSVSELRVLLHQAIAELKHAAEQIEAAELVSA